jgi:hypothetical protein
MSTDLPWDQEAARLRRLGFSETEISKQKPRKPRNKVARGERVPLEHEEMQDLKKACDGEWGRRLGIQGEIAAVPNSAAGSRTAAAYFRSEGVRPGYPDAILDVPVAPFHGLRIEMKRIRGGSVDPDQERWHERLRRRGYAVIVPAGHKEAMAMIEAYLGGCLVHIGATRRCHVSLTEMIEETVAGRHGR